MSYMTSFSERKNCEEICLEGLQLSGGSQVLRICNVEKPVVMKFGRK